MRKHLIIVTTCPGEQSESHLVFSSINREGEYNLAGGITIYGELLKGFKTIDDAREYCSKNGN